MINKELRIWKCKMRVIVDDDLKLTSVCSSA